METGVNFERRRNPRFSVNLPTEYWQTHGLKSRPSRTINISKGGLQLHLSEPLEIGQTMRLALFTDFGPDLNPIEALVQVVWKDKPLGKDGHYQIGVKIIDISWKNMDQLQNLLNILMNSTIPSA
jgi:c-di-GMP-binding flagellar brake protein YcgR